MIVSVPCFTLQLLQSYMDEFGKSDRVRDPPTCLVTVYATIGPNTTPHLSYCVPIEGVVSNMNEIFINRLLEQPNLSQGT